MGRFSKIKWGDGLDVTDEGGGVIRVDGSGGPPGETGPTGATGATGAAGSLATDSIWAAKGDVVAATGNDAASVLTLGTNGHVLTADSAQSNGIKWAAAAGGGVTVKAYVAFTSDVGIASATEGTPTDIVSAGSVSYSAVLTKVEFYSPAGSVGASAGAFILNLWEDSTNLGRIAHVFAPAGTPALEVPIYVVRYLTPSAASHTYKISGYRLLGGSGTNIVRAGAGGSGALMPGFIRVTTGS